MRQKFRHRRKTSKDLKAALDMAANFLRLPFVRPVLIITAAVCLLMIVLPWAVVRFTPEKPEKEKVLLPEAGFELKEVPSDITIYRTASGTAETIDFEDYVKTKERAFKEYEDRMEWARKMLINISKAGYFSSDRTISEYNNDIWKL